MKQIQAEIRAELEPGTVRLRVRRVRVRRLGHATFSPNPYPEGRLDFRRSLVCAGSFSEQRLVIEPIPRVANNSL